MTDISEEERKALAYLLRGFYSATELDAGLPPGMTRRQLVDEIERGSAPGARLAPDLMDIGPQDHGLAIPVNPDIGGAMDDGTVYAGSLDGREIYTTPKDAPLTYTFNEATDYASWLNREKYLGHDDWRVPTKDELNVLYENKDNGALKGTFNEAATRLVRHQPECYWSSSQDFYGYEVWAQRFTDGNQRLALKLCVVSLRCVRG